MRINKIERLTRSSPTELSYSDQEIDLKSVRKKEKKTNNTSIDWKIINLVLSSFYQLSFILKFLVASTGSGGRLSLL